jgi:Helix-turn-helix domain
VATRRQRTLADLEKHGPMRTTRKVPAQERPTYYRAVGLQAAREAAGMTQAEVADLCGYSVGVYRQYGGGHRVPNRVHQQGRLGDPRPQLEPDTRRRVGVWSTDTISA